MTVRELDRPPRLGALYARAAVPRLGRDPVLPDTEVVVRDIPIDRSHLAAYDRLCGFTVSDVAPCTYLHVLAFPLHVEIMADAHFPFPLPGLVHIRNRITQRHAVTAEDTVTLRVRAEHLRPHRKGSQFDVVASATIGEAEVWTGRSTYLRRGKGSDTAPDQTREPPTRQTVVWHAPADTGRRYAAVSGDHNPIHLNRIAARLFGFPRAIAHGMWSKARCLAAVADRLDGRHIDVDVQFARPVLLPSTLALARADSGSGVTFALRTHRRDDVHLTGTVTT